MTKYVFYIVSTIYKTGIYVELVMEILNTISRKVPKKRPMISIIDSHTYTRINFASF